MTGTVRQFVCDNGHEWAVAATMADSHPELFCPICQAPGHKAVGCEGTNGSLADDTHGAFAGFTILRRIGKGGMGIVYLAIDQRHGGQVALKTLPLVTADTLHRFRREFQSLRDVLHPHLIKLHNFYSDGEHWFFTMEYVPGVNLREHFEGLLHANLAPTEDNETTRVLARPLPSAEYFRQVRHVFDQLADAIGVLHDAGILHRDIKPSNVLVRSDGHVVLLDFGLVTHWSDQAELSHTEHAVGTMQYMAPEQALAAPQPASDWYSLGVMLYEALTGQMPFLGNWPQMLQRKQHEPPRRPREIQPAVPDDLDGLCMELLAADAQQRPLGEEIRRRLNAERLSGIAATPEQDRLEASLELLGRDEHLAAMQAAFAELQQGRPLSCFVVGSSGMGKSALSEAFLRSLADCGAAMILRGRCYEQESIPFKALDGLIDDLTRQLRSLPPEEAAAVVPRDGESLLRVFPVLGRVAALARLPARQGPAPDQQELRRRAGEALRELFSRLGDYRPLVVFVDDLQWGDKDSADLLVQILRPPDAPRMLFLGSYRQEDAASSAFLTALAEHRCREEATFARRELRVSALSYADAVALAGGLLGGNAVSATGLAEQIATESGGIPFFIRELVLNRRDAVQTGGGLPLDRCSLDEVIWSRVQALPADCRRVLETVAIAGRPISLDEIRAVIDAVDDPSLNGPVQRLRLAHLLRVVDASGATTVESYHDRVRESVVGHLAADRKCELHRRLAVAWEETGDPAIASAAEAWAAGNSQEKPRELDKATTDWAWVFELAWHFGEAGEWDRAQPYAYWAARHAQSQHALEVAEQHYRIASQGTSQRDAALRCQIAEGLGDVLMLRGKYPDAAEQFEVASKAAESAEVLARIEGKIGVLALKCGNPIGACRAIERALGLMGCSVPATSISLYISVLFQIGLQVLHTLRPRLDRATQHPCVGEDYRLRTRLFRIYANSCWFVRGSVWSIWTHLRSMNLSEKGNLKPEMAQNYADHAPAMSLVGWFRRGLRYGRRSYQLRKQLSDPWGQAQSLNFIGILLYAAAHFRGSIRLCRRSIQTIERLGDVWEQNMARFHVAASLYRLGDLAPAVDEAIRMHQLGCQVGDVQASGISLDIWAKASLGRVPPEIQQREIQRQNPYDAQAKSQLLQAKAVVALADGDCRAAVAALREAALVARKKGVMNAYISPVQPWLATALRLAARQGGTTESAERKSLFRQAAAAAKRGCRIGRRFKSDLPQALREAAMLAALRGRPRQARRLFEQSLAVARRLRMRYELAQTQFAFGHAGRRFGWPAAERQMAEAAEQLRHFDAALGGDRSTVVLFGLEFFP